MPGRWHGKMWAVLRRLVQVVHVKGAVVEAGLWPHELQQLGEPMLGRFQRHARADPPYAVQSDGVVPRYRALFNHHVGPRVVGSS